MKNSLKSMFTGHWEYLAINAACELKLFDKIFEGFNTSEKLILKNNWNSKALKHLLEFLVRNEYLSVFEKGTFSITPKGNLLREENTDGLYYACLNWSSEHLIAWQNLKYSVISGDSSFEQIYQKPYFEYLNEHPDKLNYYHKAMYEYARDDYKNITHIIDFSIHKSIMDVGGGFGAAISLIQKKNPYTKCFLFDLDKVIKQVNENDYVLIGGDFLEVIPNCAEAILLSRVLHDWNDEKASLILQNCFKALPANGTLYVIENCKDKIQNDLSLLSLNMMVMCKSFERSFLEYKNLCATAGFIFQSENQLNQLQTILTFIK